MSMIDENTGWIKWTPTEEEAGAFYSEGVVPFSMHENQYLIVFDPESQTSTYYCYEHGELRNFRGGSIKTIQEILEDDEKEPKTDTKGKKKKPKYSKGKQTIINPRNDEQHCAFDLIKDDTKTIKLLTGSWGTGKAQPDDTQIPTPSGVKRLKDLCVGDYVFDRKGLPTKVLGVYPQGVIDNYKVTFSDGRTTYCNSQHIWSCYNSRKTDLKDYTIEEMLRTGLETKEGKSHRYFIPYNSPLQYPTKDFTVDPYVVGAFIGDGCCLETGLSLSTGDEEVVQIVAELLGGVNYYRICPKGNFTWCFKTGENIKGSSRILTRDVFGALPTIMRRSEEKLIPDEYLYGDVDQRLSLLQGLLDTDGCVSRGQRIRYTSVNYRLIQQIQQLCWSLGFQATINVDERPNKYCTGACYTLFINCSRKDKPSCFRISRKKNLTTLDTRKNAKQEYHRSLAIVNIEKMTEPVPMRCIYVDNDEHLYLTNDCIVTHNTMILVTAALEALRLGKFDQIVWIRNNVDVKDTKDLGALPGEVIDKLLPFLGPFVDHAGEASVRTMIAKETLRVEPLQSLRGRNFENTLILCSEAENLTKEHIQLIIARAAEGSEVWIDGDCRQRDRASFEKSKGLETMIERLAGEELFGHVHLIKSERSATARLADKLD